MAVCKRKIWNSLCLSINLLFGRKLVANFHQFFSRVFILIALFAVLVPVNAQFDPNQSNTSSCPPNACTPGCGPGGPGGPDCTGLVCPPDPEECNPNTQSCVDPDPNPDPPSCEGTDCGDNQCNATSNAAAGSS
ncbi:MAG: hypothetical protein ACRBHB_26075, partial [Arenicella sp.]